MDEIFMFIVASHKSRRCTTHLAVISGPHATVSIVRVCSHLRVHSIIVMLLLL